MKFAHVFKQTLQNEGFPPDWVASAISYSQLKKCINRLTNELAQVGLDPPTLGKLLRHVEEQNASVEANDDDRPIKYLLVDGDAGDGESTRSTAVKKAFHPKLLFYINEATGELDSAHLDTPTRQKLQQIAVETGATPLRVFEEPEREDSPDRASCSATSCSDHKSIKRRPGYKTVEIPLTSDSEFFSKLTSELSGLEALQEREEKRMHAEIVKLGNQVATLTDPDRKANKKLLTVWRQLFQIYLENDIFFGTTEADHEGRDADKAAERFQKFANTVAQQKLLDNFKRPEQIEAINTFMHINREILQGLRFGEINRTAMMKILKKFDKQTALGVRTTSLRQIEYPEFSAHLAKAVCAEVSTQIISHVPQIDDYSCPMCFELKWRPVRLRCKHVFCIRCLIVMQTNKQDFCPLCRQKTVVDANSDNLDVELAHFLKKWFPDEVKAKQKYNEMMAGVDQYGEVYNHKCTIM